MKKQHIIIIAVIVVFWIGHGIIASNNRQTENTTTENQTDVRGGTAELEKNRSAGIRETGGNNRAERNNGSNYGRTNGNSGTQNRG